MIVDAIPAELKAIPQWVHYKLVRKPKKDGTTKLDKVPHDAKTGKKGDVTDPATWSSFEVASAINKMDGFGFAVTKADPYVGVDLDNCIDDGGDLAAWAHEIIAELDSYTEITPSGRGIRIWVKGTLPPEGRRRGPIELYNSDRFFTMTGQRWPGTPSEIADRAGELLALHARVFQKPRKPKEPTARPNTPPSDQATLDRMFRSKNGQAIRSLFEGDTSKYSSPSEADLALCSHLVFHTGGDAKAVDRLFRLSGLSDDKWTGREDYRDKTIGKAMEGVANFYDPSYRSAVNGHVGSGTNTPPPRPSASTWLEPILDVSTASIPFPTEILPPMIADLAHVGADRLGCPVDFFGVSLLGIASGAIGRSVAVAIKESWIEQASLYMAPVGDPGAMKSPPLALLGRPLWEITDSLLVRHKEEIAIAKANDTPSPTPRRLVVDDTTVERLAPLLQENPRGLIMLKDELTAWVMGMNQYKAGGKGADRQFFLSAWSGSPVAIDRKSNPGGLPIVIPRPFLSILGALTPGMLGELSEAKGRDDGFLDRMLFAFPDPVRVRWQPEGIPGDLLNEWSATVRNLWGRPMVHDPASAHPRPFIVHLTPDATSYFGEWFNSHCNEAEGEDFPSYLKGAWSKLRAYCGRLALVLSLLHETTNPTADPNRPPDIDPASIGRAISLIGYFKAHTRRVRSLIRGSAEDNEDATEVIGWLKRTRRTTFSERDARRNFPARFAESRALESAMTWLVNRRCIRPKEAMRDAHRPGRPPSPSYEVNPVLVSDADDG